MLTPELLAKVRQIYIKGRNRANDLFTGEYRSAFRGTGMEFEEYREYVPGDDIRAIDWNVSLRMDRTFIKLYREEREQTVIILFDLSASLSFGTSQKSKKEVATEIAALLAFAAVQGNDKIGLLLFSEEAELFLPPRRSRGYVWKVIQKIMTHKAAGRKTRLDQALRFLAASVRRPAVCFLISDFLAPDFQDSLKAAASRHDIVPIVVRDPVEQFFPGQALIKLKDLETDKECWFDATNKKSKKEFHEKIRENEKTLKTLFASLRLDPLFLSTDSDYFTSLIRLFHRRDKH